MKALSVWNWLRRCSFVGAAALFVVATPVDGARITWSDPIDAGTNLPVNNGSVIEAVNSGGPAVTINGIEFMEGEDADAVTSSNLSEAFPECCSDNGAPTGASEDMEVMLDSHRWMGSGGAATVATLKLEGLDVGSDYQIQVYYSDFRPGSFKTYFWLGGGGASTTFTRGTVDENASFIGTFTADSDQQNVHLVPDGTRLDGFVNHDPGLSGYVLSSIPADAIPEPSALLLSCLAISGLVVIRRRRSLTTCGLAALSMLLVINAGASAAIISWSDPIDASTNLPVNNGTVMEAVNSGGIAVTINGIDFMEGEDGDSIVHSNLAEAFPDCCSDNGAPTGASADMEVMLDSHRWLGTGGQPSVATLILDGLEVGKDYSIQLYYSDFRPGSFKEYYWAGDGGSVSELFTRGTTEDNWSFIGKFTADSDQQRVHQIPNGTRLDGFVNHDPGISGYVLSESGDPCDFDGDGSLGLGDINLLLQAVKAGDNDPGFDVTSDGLVDQRDINFFVQDPSKLNSYVGDADMDGVFGSGDLVKVFTGGQYEDGIAMNSEWQTGDWNGDAEFGSGDLVVAFTEGGYELGPRNALATGPDALPEPSSFCLFLLGGLALYTRRGKS